jgi:hypothetical protein
MIHTIIHFGQITENSSNQFVAIQRLQDVTGQIESSSFYTAIFL